jgi:hypothetical protein
MDRTIDFLKKIPRGYYFFGIFAFFFVALMVFVEIKNGKFWTNDLKVYYLAAQDFFNGGNPYENPYGLGSGFFKYPPTTLYFFAPLSAMAYFWAQISHTIMLLISLIGSLFLLHHTFIFRSEELSNKKRLGLMYLFFVFIAVHIVREVHLGNVNLLLLFLFVAGMIAYLKGKENYLVLCWGLMVIIKPIVILAFLPLLFMLMWRVILKMAGLGVLFFLIPFLHKGTGGIELWNDWFEAVSAHGDYIVSENCLKYLSSYYLSTNSVWLPSLIVFSVLVAVLSIERIKYGASKDLFISWAAILLAFNPNFFVTDTEHFLLCLPMIVLLVKEIIHYGKLWLWIPFTLLMVGFALKSNDLWGKELSSVINEMGLLGLSNLAFIVFYGVMRQRSLSVQQLKVN